MENEKIREELLKLDTKVSDEIKRLLDWRKGRSKDVQFGIHMSIKALNRIRKYIDICENSSY